MQERLAHILAGRSSSNGDQRVYMKKQAKRHQYVINSRANNNPIIVNNANGAYWISIQFYVISIQFIIFFILFIFRK